MQPGTAQLSSKERDALRLLASGHDAKSIARELGLSVHTVNERLRSARRKLGVSSSREAARIVAAEEADGHQKPVYKDFGLAAGQARSPNRRPYIAMGAVVVLTLSLAGAVLLNHLASSAAADHPAKVVATSPRQGSAIAPGPFQLSVTYDRPLMAGAYSFVQVSDETFPQCEGRPILSRDRRTYSWTCRALPGRSYEIWFNREPYMNFRTPDGRSAQPFRLTFRAQKR